MYPKKKVIIANHGEHTILSVDPFPAGFCRVVNGITTLHMSDDITLIHESGSTAMNP
jgi:hypothetical protein